MTTVSDDLIRAFLADEARRAVAAAPSLQEAAGRLAPRIEGRPSGAPQRLIVLLAATLLLVAALSTAVAVGSGIVRLPLVIDSPAVSPFEGTWVSTSDIDGGTQTMTVRALEDGALEIMVHDDIASVCSRTPSTMTGTGRLQGSTEFVIASPVYTCNDGSQAEALSGPPLEEQLRDLTFVHDPEADTLADNFGGVWLREGAAAESPAPPPSEQVPPSSEAEVTALLNGFLEARVAGEAAQQYLNVPEEDIPLLYATSSGAPYERGEFEPVRDTEWPYGFMAFKVRLLAGDTVVEQLFFTPHDDPEHFPADGRLRLEYDPHGFATHIAPTTENGQPVALPYDSFDGEVTLRAAHPWVFHDGSFGRLIPEGPGVGPTTDGGQRSDWDHLVLMADPAAVEVEGGCQTSPRPADAEALAESIQSYPLEATAPVAVSAGGAEGLMMDVKISAGAIICGPASGGGDPEPGILNPVFDQHASALVDDGLITGVATGEWMRLYLFAVPEGLSMRILAIAIVAPESRFERAVQAAAPVVDSVEFHPP